MPHTRPICIERAGAHLCPTGLFSLLAATMNLFIVYIENQLNLNDKVGATPCSNMAHISCWRKRPVYFPLLSDASIAAWSIGSLGTAERHYFRTSVGAVLLLCSAETILMINSSIVFCSRNICVNWQITRLSRKKAFIYALIHILQTL